MIVQATKLPEQEIKNKRHRYESTNRRMEHIISNVYGHSTANKRRKFMPLSTNQSKRHNMSQDSTHEALPEIKDNLKASREAISPQQVQQKILA